MIVYMLLNTVTERAYIGATKGTLDDRWKSHLKETVATPSRLGRALQQWPEEVWQRIVLCHCYSLEELAQAERAWQEICNVFDEAVGYNDRVGNYQSTFKMKEVASNPLTADVKPSSPLAGLSIEQRREYFREAGRRGAKRRNLIGS